MDAAIDRHLADMAAREEADRRNASYSRHLLTELGDIELNVPLTRRYGALEVVRAYARRAAHVDRMILACFVLGLSTRKVASALLPVLGRRVIAGTVSTVAKSLNGAVAAFHRRPLKDCFQVLMLDGVVLTHKTGAGAVRRPVLVALGLRPDGKKIHSGTLGTSNFFATIRALRNRLDTETDPFAASRSNSSISEVIPHPYRISAATTRASLAGLPKGASRRSHLSSLQQATLAEGRPKPPSPTSGCPVISLLEITAEADVSPLTRTG
jgi:Transposase, Mutator family